MDALQQEVAKHFDTVARDYDFWKKKNWYYYDTLHAIARAHTASAKRLLDVGCGTGTMMGIVAPPSGTGIDISPQMIAVARRNNAAHPEYSFEAADVTGFTPATTFDAILFFDVVEHVTDIPATLRSLHDLLAPGGNIVFTMANPLWEPILMLTERWGLKMPEGPHHRIWGGELLRRASAAGLVLKEREWHLIFPKHIPYISWFLNEVIGKIPFIRRGAVIEVFIFTRT